MNKMQKYFCRGYKKSLSDRNPDKLVAKEQYMELIEWLSFYKINFEDNSSFDIRRGHAFALADYLSLPYWKI